jgi:alginate O-acetyltransferase complex protein AlgI
MVFSSTIFVFFFLPTALLLYYLIPSGRVSLRNGMLTLCSLAFYVWGETYNVFLLLIMFVANYVIGKLIYRDGREEKKTKVWLIIGIVLNLSTLFVYKYSGWIAGMLGLDFVPSFILPLGISFFTFHAISYLVDIYRREIQASRNILNFATYFVMFPHLVAGPIVRFAHVMEDLRRKRGNLDLFYSGVCRFVVGLAKKTLIANQVALIADAAFSVPMDTLGTGTAWLGAIAYTLQIYFDFSAYSDMAIGLAAMFGFRFHENFDHPYSATSIQDFWKRWHISLSSWLRDYLYIPLGGNRKGNRRTYINLLLIFFFCGLWHGANWTFILWGLFHGVFLVIERFGFARWLDSKSVILTRFYVILTFITAWVIFRADSLTQAFGYLKNMFFFQFKEIPVVVEYKFSTQFWIALVVGIFASSGIPVKLWRRWRERVMASGSEGVYESANLGYGVLLVLLSSMSLLAGTYNPFIYFRF